MLTDKEIVLRFSTAHRSADALRVRIDLLREASAALDEERFASLLRRCWRRGDLEEQYAVLRALPDLCAPERHLLIAREGARSNVRRVFEAIATDNPYPSRWFDEASFDQMVIKALFVGAPLARIVGLEERRSPTLCRMAADFAAERRAARRAVPADAVALAEGGRIA